MFETKHETENMMLDIEMDTSATDKHFSMGKHYNNAPHFLMDFV